MGVPRLIDGSKAGADRGGAGRRGTDAGPGKPVAVLVAVGCDALRYNCRPRCLLTGAEDCRPDDDVETPNMDDSAFSRTELTKA